MSRSGYGGQFGIMEDLGNGKLAMLQPHEDSQVLPRGVGADLNKNNGERRSAQITLLSAGNDDAGAGSAAILDYGDYSDGSEVGAIKLQLELDRLTLG